MKIVQELAQFAPDRESVLTIGVFDGMHKGHSHLISHLTAQAMADGRLSGVVTFRNHPASVLRPDFKPRFLTTVDQRLRLIGDLGVDLVVPVSFDLELSRLSAREFCQLLKRHLRMSGLVVGPDFALGSHREGDVRLLRMLGRDMGFSLDVVEPLVDAAGSAVRSTAIREALAGGDVTRVAALLGRGFALEGVVVRGSGRGGPLGFPTANLRVPDELAWPGDGIYATWAVLGARRFMAAASIGTRPTFGGVDRILEAHLLEFDGDLYGRQLRLEFVRRLRDEARFESVRDLQDQVDRDVAQAKEVLRSAGAEP